MQRWMFASLVVAFAGCPPPPVEAPTTTVVQETTVRPPRRRDDVDVLFMVDNSGSMQPKINELRNRFGELIRQLESFRMQGHPAHYHLGVVTSDVDCGGMGGQGGKLQLLGAAADASCRGVTGGKRFIDYNQIDGSNNLPSGQSLETTFRCMASVGDQGCLFEQNLESAYRALHDPIPENEGFLRPGALLVVVFVTDEDDCSLAPNSPLYSATIEAPFPGGIGFPSSFRCTQFGLQCGGMQPPTAAGRLSMCEPLPNPSNDPGKLYDVQKYIDFFTKAGGVKQNREDVILVSISGPAARVETVLARADTGMECPAFMANGNRSCVPFLVPGCSSRTEVNWVGSPAVRMEAVVKSAANFQITSICEDSYAPALEGVGNLIISALGNCLTQPIATPEKPECVVQELLDKDGTLSTVGVIGSCDATAGIKPCWSLATNPLCTAVRNPLTGTDDRFEVRIDRGSAPEDPNRLLAISCSTIAYRQ